MDIKKDRISKSVYLKRENFEFIREKAEQENTDFSNIVNKTIEIRRYNEQFNSCQNEF